MVRAPSLTQCSDSAKPVLWSVSEAGKAATRLERIGEHKVEEENADLSGQEGGRAGSALAEEGENDDGRTGEQRDTGRAADGQEAGALRAERDQGVNRVQRH